MRHVLLTLVLVAGCGGSDVSRELGARCDDSTECDDKCLLPDDWPGGFCSLSCDRDDDCPIDSLCVDVEGGVCLFLCDGVEDCRFLGQGWTCQTEPDRPDGEGVMVCVGA